MNRIWRNDEDGRAILLTITEAGFAAIGVEPEAAAGEMEGPSTTPTGVDKAPIAAAPENTPAEIDPAPKARTPRTGTKQEDAIAMLRRKEGATIEEIVAATNWLPHTVRGFFAGALKKRLGLEVTSETVEGRGPAYKLPAA
jgi:hypothetical protein